MRTTNTLHPGRTYARLLSTLVGIVLGLAGSAFAASQNVDLDAKSGNGNESNLSLSVISSYPAKIRNKVTNKTGGDAFTFNWMSAGPGGFSASVPAGTSTGVGAIWDWQTNLTIYSYTGKTCDTDICFAQTGGPDAAGARGPFQAPGRSLSSSGVTVSSASLTSSLITFFSPPSELVSVTSSVKLLSSGLFAYTTRVQNNTQSTITLEQAPAPPGCCNDVHQLNCSGTCVYYLTDPANCGACGNACGSAEYCSSGACVSICPAGKTACGDDCVDLQNDPLNCGSCGHACGDNQICTGGACVTCTPPQQTACDNKCTNIHTDPYNCGGCGINCNFLCPSTGQGTCSQGNSCRCVPGLASASSPGAVVEAPLCVFPGTSDSIPPGQALVECETHAVLAKEVQSELTLCGDSIPAGQFTCHNGQPGSQGSFNKLGPDFTQPIGNTTLSPFHVETSDPSGDRILQPGETGRLTISLLNSGPVTLKTASVTLSSPPIDLTTDGTDNPVAVTITGATEAYSDILGTPNTGSGDCSNLDPAPENPSSSSIPFSVTVPLNHPSDVGRPFNLHVTGTSGGVPFAADVPIVIGIGSKCDPAVGDGNFDGLNGLQSPMAQLVLPGDTVPYPSKPFAQGKTRPMKLNLTCGGLNLSSDKITPPRIVALSRGGVPIDITKINLNDDANSNDPFFRYNSSGSAWLYNMRTKDLATGNYVITIRLAGTQDYVTGFVLN